MRSEPMPGRRIAAALAAAAVAGATLPVPATAHTVEIQVCGQTQPIWLPIRKRTNDHDTACATACHATDPRKRRGSAC